MSEENVEIVRRSFELVNEVGTDAFIGGNFWSDDWVFDPSGTGIGRKQPSARYCVGHVPRRTSRWFEP
jgi:hypothetical protein